LEEIEQLPEIEVTRRKDVSSKGEKPEYEEETITVQGVSYGDTTYTAEDLEKIFREIIALQSDEELEPSEIPDEEVELTRRQWLEAKAYGWGMIFYIPAAFVFIVSGFFFVFGKDPAKEEDPTVHPEEIDDDTSGGDSGEATGGEGQPQS
jgi:hypothetical protein